MEKKRTKFGNWWQAHKPTKRRIIQLYAALLTNANIKGFFSGKIYQGGAKNMCVPGMNCYSCPGAAASCPLGALQNALGSSNARLPFYIFGILMLFGLMFGRFICGFLCPFGLIQDLLHKIKTPKMKKNRFTRILSYLKYVILVVFVILMPLIYSTMSFPMPGFCKYICPSGTLLGAGGLLSNSANEKMLSMLGPLFTWKFVLLVVIIVGAVFMYRFFCRFLCPLGAIYGFFNKISLLGIKVDKPKCTDCGLCVGHCDMDVLHVGDHECISCGKCVNVCPTGAISYKGPKILLAPNEVGGRPNVKNIDPVDAPGTPLPKKTNIARSIVAGVMIVAMIASLVYYNFIHKDPVTAKPPASSQTGPEVGGEVGDLCYDYELDVYGQDENIKISDFRGKVTLVNFWYIYCSSCVKELETEFPKVKDHYGDEIEILAIHSYQEYNSDIPAFINEKFPDEDFIFCRDGEGEELFHLLGGEQAWPVTVVLDQEGVIVETIYGGTTYEELCTIIDGIDTDAPAKTEGGNVGDLCYDFELDLYGSNGTTSVKDYRGKVTLVNFWYIYCSSCVKELETEFPLVKDKYGDQIEILAVHSNQEYNSDIPAFIAEKFPGEDFIFCRDQEGEAYFHMLGGDQAWPITVILDQDGIIVQTIYGGTTANELSTIIDGILAK